MNELKNEDMRLEDLSRAGPTRILVSNSQLCEEFERCDECRLVEEYIGEFLVVATGENSEGFIPSVYGLNNLKVSCCMESFVNTKQKGQTKDYLISNERSSAIDVGTASWIQTGDTQVMTTSKDIEGDVINFDDGQERQLDELMPLLLAIQKSNSIQKIKSEALR
ncbi:hypothetical protein Tco_0639183 [Tanacetum coccineum]